MGDIRQTGVRYSLLGDETWLRQKYEEERLSTSEIAILVGCSKDAVRLALLRLGIELRSAKETNVAIYERRGFRSKYALLNDKEWVNRRYNEDGLSLEEVAELVGARNHNSVRQALVGHGFKVRNRSEGITFGREDDGFVVNDEVITGGLLGDDTLKIWNKDSPICCPVYRKKNKTYDHVLYVAKLLFGENAESRIRPVKSVRGGRSFPAFLAESLSHQELRPYFDKWYPETSGHVKVVPEDIRLTPVVLLHWFLDDGSTSFRPERGDSVRLAFCSESFSKEDQQRLCDLMNISFGLKAKISPCSSGTGFRIKIPESKVPDFFEVIGPCPDEITSMKYKWKVGNVHR